MKKQERAVLEVKADGTVVPMPRKAERAWRKSIKTNVDDKAAKLQKEKP